MFNKWMEEVKELLKNSKQSNTFARHIEEKYLKIYWEPQFMVGLTPQEAVENYTEEDIFIDELDFSNDIFGDE